MMTSEPIRYAAVAGEFYPADPIQLTETIARFFTEVEKKDIGGDISGILVPHAGYQYSGQTAAFAYKLLEGMRFENIIIIAPSHTQAIEGASIYNGNYYQTPLGKVAVNQELAQKICDYDPALKLSDKAHSDIYGMQEHSIEVQLPFLQILFSRFQILPIHISLLDWQLCETLSVALASNLKKEKALLVASSDLSHFRNVETAFTLDKRVTDGFKSLDAQKLFSDFKTKKASACGEAAILSLILSCQKLGADAAEILDYSNSGRTSGDFESVVGYASGVLYQS